MALTLRTDFRPFQPTIVADEAACRPAPICEVIPFRANAGSRTVRSGDVRSPGGSPLSAAPVAGSEPVDLMAEDVEGVWCLRFGMFGCPDSEMRGGVIHVEDGCVVGGDSNFAYLGQYWLHGTELRAALDVTRHSENESLATIFGGADMDYRLDCVAEAITPDLFEGRLRRAGYPDARLTMRRIVFRQI